MHPVSISGYSLSSSEQRKVQEPLGSAVSDGRTTSVLAGGLEDGSSGVLSGASPSSNSSSASRTELSTRVGLADGLLWDRSCFARSRS